MNKKYENTNLCLIFLNSRVKTCDIDAIIINLLVNYYTFKTNMRLKVDSTGVVICFWH